MKKIVSIIASSALAVSAFSDIVRFPGGQYSAYPVINSASTTNGVVNFPAWPISVAASTSVTNVTFVNVAGGSTVAVQFTASAMQTNGGAVTLRLGRNVQGGSPTNAVGTGLNIEWFDTLTNTLPANTATSANTVVGLYATPTTMGNVSGDGACNGLYLGWITTPANVTLTNYSVYVNNK